MHKMDSIPFFYINLQRRPDRERSMRRTLRTVLGVSRAMVRRIEAKDAARAGCRSYSACTWSHLRAVSAARASGAPVVCIMEDDWTLRTSVREFWGRIGQWLSSKQAWNVTFISMSPIALRPVDASTGVFRVDQALSMSGYLVRASYLDKLEAILRQGLSEKRPHDLVTQLHQRADRWFGFWPPLGYQAAGASDIEKKEVDYAYMDRDGAMWPDSGQWAGWSWSPAM